ncbi:hypothetical protein ACFFHK_05030 [Gallibacterium trehalosifermentans]|uniref:Lipoprotein n=1 Tax=Gallibacterium trehalosifermentans TaxID=516935 RepID=A0ABV6H0B3_9PAST
MIKKLSVFTCAVMALLLSACSQLSFPGNSTGAGKTVSTNAEQQENAKLNALKESALKLPSFTYETAMQTATAYFDQRQIAFIVVKNSQQTEHIYVKNGKIIAVTNNKQSYDLGKGQLSNEAVAVGKTAEKWLQKLSYNAADRNISAVRTGDEAKLNYLCIAKVQQVAGTKKVLRTSANSAQSTSRLTASMRLNGNQFYQMDCVLSGDRVAKLSLIAK